MNNIAIITARSGSKGIKDKNIKILNGKPLIAYSIQVALDSNIFDKIIVSTDSKKYADIAKEYGAEVPFLRTEANSTDNASSWDVVREVMERLEKERDEYYDNILLLQPTSPLRTTEDIIKSYNMFTQKKANSIIGVTEMEHSPLWSNVLPYDLSMENFEDKRYRDCARQNLPTYYRINGAIYWVTKAELYNKKMLEKNTYAYIMPRERSIDIDSNIDFLLAETIMKSEIFK